MTEVALRDYLETKLNECDRRHTLRGDLSDRALAFASQAIDNRTINRVEHDALVEKVEALRREKANLDGRILIFAIMASIVTNGTMWLIHMLFVK
jgi:hypothetical protein